MNKHLQKAIILLPFVFMIHNIEEAFTISNSPVHTYLANTFQFIIAVSLFTILGFIILKKSLYQNIQQYKHVVLAFSGMLYLNSFFPHILSSIYFKTYTPGLFSATFLVLPLTSYILLKIYQEKTVSIKQMAITIFLGAIIGALLVILFLGVGYIIS